MLTLCKVFNLLWPGRRTAAECKNKYRPPPFKTTKSLTDFSTPISGLSLPWLSTPYFASGGSGWLAGRMPANWRADCHATGGCVPPGTAGSSQRDNAAAGGQHKTMLSSMNRAVGRVSRGETAGTQCRGFTRSGIRHWGGFADNISCVATGFASFMPAVRRARLNFRVQFSRHSRASAKPLVWTPYRQA